MEGSMSLKKRAVEGIVVAGSLVMMGTIAQAADLDGVQVRNAAVQAETDFATGGTAGVVARLDQLETEAFGDIEAATAGVNQSGRLLVATPKEQRHSRPQQSRARRMVSRQRMQGRQTPVSSRRMHRAQKQIPCPLKSRSGRTV